MRWAEDQTKRLVVKQERDIGGDLAALARLAHTPVLEPFSTFSSLA